MLELPARGRRASLAATALTLLLAAATPAVAQSDDGGTSTARPEPQTPISYEPRIEGLSDHEGELDRLMRESGVAFRLIDKPPETVDALRRRARQDLERFDQIMDSLGFYDGRVEYQVREPTDDEERLLVFTVHTGPRYLLEEVLIRRGAGAEPVSAGAEELTELGLHVGMPAKAEAIIDAETKLLSNLEQSGHPYAGLLERRTVIHPDRKTMTVTYGIDPGPGAGYGEVRIHGEDRVDERHIRNYVPWQQGATYDRRQLDELRDDLTKTDLFRAVEVGPAGEVGADGNVPIEVTVEERPPRSIGFGVNYATGIGPGAEAYWEHRNFSGQGETIRLSVEGSRVEQGVEGRFRKPLFLDRDQDLIADGELKNLQTDAFDEKRGAAFIGVERDLGEYWSVSIGPTLEYTRVDNAESREGNFLLGGVRSGVRRSTVEDPLDPRQGTTFDLGVTPYTSLDDKDLHFVKSSVAGSAYYAIDDAERYVLAGRAKYGNILGGTANELPAGMRFYAGGGGSVRGYEFQTVGPLAEDGDPLGGKSLVEFGAELRARITENVGIVPFVDAGNVYRKNVPDSFDLLWAAGLGVRYYTGVGPIRADIAIPIDRRDVDDAFQFYFSLGQAF